MWASKYVGIPFKPHGRTREGCDCYGLVRLVLQEEFGKSLPGLDYEAPSSAKETERLIDLTTALVNATRVDDPQPGDVVIMAIYGIESHVGVYSGEGRVLHVLENQGAVLARIDSAMVAKRVKGFYRVD